MCWSVSDNEDRGVAMESLYGSTGGRAVRSPRRYAGFSTAPLTCLARQGCGAAQAASDADALYGIWPSHASALASIRGVRAVLLLWRRAELWAPVHDCRAPRASGARRGRRGVGAEGVPSSSSDGSAAVPASSMLGESRAKCAAGGTGGGGVRAEEVPSLSSDGAAAVPVSSGDAELRPASGVHDAPLVAAAAPSTNVKPSAALDGSNVLLPKSSGCAGVVDCSNGHGVLSSLLGAPADAERSTSRRSAACTPRVDVALRDDSAEDLEGVSPVGTPLHARGDRLPAPPASMSSAAGRLVGQSEGLDVVRDGGRARETADARSSRDGSQRVRALGRAPAGERGEEGEFTGDDERRSPVMFGNMPLRHWRDVPTFPQWCAYQDSLPREERCYSSSEWSQGSPSPSETSSGGVGARR